MPVTKVGQTLALLCASVLFTNSAYANDNFTDRFSFDYEQARYQNYLQSQGRQSFAVDVPIPRTVSEEPAPTPEEPHYEGREIPCTVTAYYSPVRGQHSYNLGSYAREIAMEGRGTNGADGTQVYEGMIAAGRQHAFGTRILIPGFGVGEVHDRGGAIRGTGRIDVWLGRGDEGREKANAWGKQKLVCVVID